MGRYTVFMDQKTRYFQDINSLQIDLQVQFNWNQNSGEIFITCPFEIANLFGKVKISEKEKEF